MSRLYYINAENVSITNAGGDADLLELQPADDKPVRLVGMTLHSLSEVGEAQEEWLRCSIVRGNATTGNGTSANVQRYDQADSAAGFTAKTYGTTPASAGTAITLGVFGWPVRAGYEIFYPDKMEFMSTQADGFLCVRLLAAPADDLSADLMFWVLEGV